MICKVVIFACLVACCAVGTKAQCIPDPVFEVELANTTLSWAVSSNCDATHYIVNIHSGGVLEYVYQVDDTNLNVAFLSYCRDYTFYVTAIADHVIGAETQFEAIIPLPSGTNISIANFSGSQIDQDVLLQWHVSTEYLYCAREYKLLLWYQDAAVPEEIRTNQNGYYLVGVAQCENFNLEINVEYLAMDHPVAQFNYTVPAKTNAPTLVDVRQDALSINTTWQLEHYSLNRCNVSALHINGTHFNATIPILDVPQRPHIEVSVPGLRANSMYFFNVTAENEAGISRPFLIAVQTLPIEPDAQDENVENDENVDRFNRY